MKTIFLFSLIAILAFSSAKAQEEAKHHFLIETDPMPLALGGFSGHFGWSPKSLEHFTFGLSMAGGMRLPEFVIEMNEKNKTVDWQVLIKRGSGLWLNYHFRENQTAWFVGFQFFTQEMELSHQKANGETDRTNTAMTALQFGYQY